MKKLVSFIPVFLLSISLFGQSSSISEHLISTNEAAFSYSLYPTQNIFTFLKLNTRNGKIYQVQFDVSDDNRMESILNIKSLVSIDAEKDGRFRLYPTMNMYNFILLDQIDGRTWQVQWSIDVANRVIIPISR
jgi:hypothetical protein